MSKLSYCLFASAITIWGVNGVSACDTCNAGANASQWVNGCCEHEPMWSDHLWDDYCNEKQAPKSKRCHARQCGGHNDCGCLPGAGRWRPRGGCSLGGFRGFAAGSCEAPIYLDSVAAPAATPAATGAHGAGCMCPACQAASNPAAHGPGCTCPQCQANAASVAPAEPVLAPAPAPADAILAPAPIHQEELQLESAEPVEPAEIAEPVEAPSPVEAADVEPPLKQQPFKLETPPADELPSN